MRMLALAGCVLLAGCAAAPVDPALVPIGYDGSVSRTSEKSASIVLTSGLVEGIFGAERVDPRFHFNHQDQRVFVASLRDELNRLKLLRVGPVAESPPADADVVIEIVFQKTEHSAHYYYLDVVMRLKSGERSFARRYWTSSGKGESAWERFTMTAPDGKRRAAKLLMARLIPEIAAFVAKLD
jgi:hypothetical protein